MDIKNFQYILVPNILRNYKCSSSGECCKSKWRIDIDKASYDKTKLFLEKEKENIDDYMEKSSNGGYVTKFANGYCKLITEDKLCRVHRDFGWDCLSDTCKVYPRILKLTSRGMEMSLVFSCASSAKLLLTEEEFKIIKVKKEDLFFMKPHTVNFMIPENNLPTSPGSRYFELEDFMIKLTNLKGELGLKLEYMYKVLQEYYESQEIQKFNFEQKLLEFKKYQRSIFDDDKVNDMIIKIVLEKETAGYKSVANEYINLFKNLKLKKDLKSSSVHFRENSFSFSLEDLRELKQKWNHRYENVLKNYLSCFIFNKEFYNYMHYPMFKMLILAVMLKTKILLSIEYLGRDLTDDELIFVIKTHDNDFSHGSNFFSDFYSSGKYEMSVDEYIKKLLTVLY